MWPSRAVRDRWPHHWSHHLPITGPSLAPPHPVPPGAGAHTHLVVAIEHLHGLALTIGSGLGAHGARGRQLVVRQPGAVVAPQARTVGHLDRLPALGIDRAPAPAVLDHELVG